MAIAIILACMLLSLLQGFLFASADTSAPVIFKITDIIQSTNFDSKMVLQNTDTINYKSKNLYAMTYKNGVALDCRITTLDGNKFISTRHFGVQYISGLGNTWNAGQKISIDYKDKTFHPEDTITFEVYDTITKKIISRDTYPHTDSRDVNWFYSYFVNHRAA
jgi:hypothetical protein